MALGNGLMWPSVLSVMSKAAGRVHQGAVQGIAGSAGSVASIVGLAGGGLLYGAFEGAVFWLAGAMVFVVFLLATTTLPRLRKACADPGAI